MSSSSWIGKSLGGRYQIESLLGQGGMSAVYKGADANLNRTVAIKLIHPHLSENPEFIDRFRVEANVVAQLRHPNIIQVYDFNQDGQVFYMVMEFVPGQTLREALDKLNQAGKSMSLVQLMKFAINICEATDYAHQRNVIHRDIKPANVLLDPQGRAILMDFGIAKIMGGPKYTATGATIGTALYMPPEQIRGDHVDARSDIYAMGVMLFEMIAGQAPYHAASPMTVLMMHIEDPIPDLSPLRPNCPADLKAVVEKALAKDPAARYQSAAAMNADLSQALSALQRSLHAPTAVGMAAVAATAQPPAGQQASGATTAAAIGAQSQTYQGTPATPTAASSSGSPPVYTPPMVVTSGGNNSKRLILLALLAFGGFAIIAGLLLALFLFTRPDKEQAAVLAGVELTGTAETALAAAGLETPSIEPLATEAPVLELTQEPVASPTVGPTATIGPTATPTPERVGLLQFSDNDQERAASFSLAIPGAAPPAAGFHYELWFSDGLDDVSMAVIDPGSDISMTVEGDENLLAAYDRALITEEPDGQNGERPLGETIFLGSLPPEASEPIRLLLSAAPEPPARQGYLVGAEEQARLATDHGGFLADALAAGNLATARQHAEHVVNILSGQDNPAFGDLNGDGLAQNPGNGFGVIAYLDLAREQIELASAGAVGAGSAELSLNAPPALLALDNAQAFLEAAIQAAGRVLASDSVAEAQQSEQALNGALAALLDGRDIDDDGFITPEAGEGGILMAYRQVLKMGAFEIFNAQDLAAGLE